MINERVSTIQATGIAPNIARLFLLAGPGKLMPQPGIVIHKIGNSRFSAVRSLDAGGKDTMILEVIDGVLRPASN